MIRIKEIPQYLESLANQQKEEMSREIFNKDIEKVYYNRFPRINKESRYNSNKRIKD